jgi:uncharacterized membrane protein
VDTERPQPPSPGFKPSYVVRGLPGHPIHPPLTDFTIGAYSAATVLGLLSVLGVSDENTATAWWLTLLLAQIVGVPTMLTGFVDWLQITTGTPLWRTATAHFVANVLASALFLVTLILGHGDYVDKDVGGLPFLLNLIAFGMLTLGGWLGGTIVFVHGMRVLRLTDEPASRAVSPVPKPEKEAAEGD